MEILTPDMDSEKISEALVSGLSSLLASARAHTERARRSDSLLSPFLADALAYERKRRAEAAPEEKKEDESNWTPREAQRKFRRTTVGDSSLASRESREYNRWLERFVDAVRACKAPAVLATEKTADPEQSLKELVGASRAGTIRTRVRHWEALVRWLSAAKGVQWPRCAADVVDYVHARQAEELRVSFPRALAAAIRWVESRVGVPEPERISQQGLFRMVLDRALVEAEVGKTILRAPQAPYRCAGFVRARRS